MPSRLHADPSGESGFKRFVTVRRTLAGIEAMAMLSKGQVLAVPANNILAQRAFVHQIFGLAA